MFLCFRGSANSQDFDKGHKGELFKKKILYVNRNRNLLAGLMQSFSNFKIIGNLKYSEVQKHNVLDINTFVLLYTNVCLAFIS